MASDRVNRPFLPMATVPKDGTLVELRHGPQQETVAAYWAGQNQAFVRDDDPFRRSLHRGTGWRPVT